MIHKSSGYNVINNGVEWKCLNLLIYKINAHDLNQCVVAFWKRKLSRVNRFPRLYCTDMYDCCIVHYAPGWLYNFVPTSNHSSRLFLSQYNTWIWTLFKRSWLVVLQSHSHLQAAHCIHPLDDRTSSSSYLFKTLNST